MVQLPPSPTVEDECTALTKELINVNGSLTAPTPSDSDSVPNHGSVNQLPIVMDSDLSDHTPINEQSKTTASPRGHNAKPKGASPSEDNIGIKPSASSSDSETRGRYSRYTEVPRPNAGQRSKSGFRGPDGDAHRARTSMPRIKTDATIDQQKVTANMRRTRSPYGYNSTTNHLKIEPVIQYTGQPPSPADRIIASPVASRQSTEALPASPAKTSRDKPYPYKRSSTCSTLSSDQSAASSEVFTNPRKSYTFDNSTKPSSRASSIKRSSIEYLSPPDVPRRRRESNHTLESEDPRETRRHRSRSRQSRAKSTSRESPYSSSTEDSRRYVRNGDDASGTSRVRLNRPSHRSERTIPEKDWESRAPRVSLNLANDDRARKVHHVRGDRMPMTPQSTSTPKSDEEYFGRPFTEERTRQSWYLPRDSLGEVITFSPAPSPPRTPQAEFTDRQTYFSSPVASQKRSQQGSRESSGDEAQTRQSRTPTLVLPLATSSATMATHHRPTALRAKTYVDTKGAPWVPPIKAKSRPSSPSHLMPSLSFPHNETHEEPVLSDHKDGTSDACQSSRRPAGGVENVQPRKTNKYQPQRNASFGGYNNSDLPALLNASQTSQIRPVYIAAQMNQETSSPAHCYHANEVVVKPSLPSGDLVLPPCPRPEVIRGFSDWYSFKEAPLVHICSSCTAGLRGTRYQQSIVRSPEKSPDIFRLCALSNPWIRFIIVRSLKDQRQSTSNVDNQLGCINKWSRKRLHPCRGPKMAIREWWLLIDPETGRTVPDFYACDACMHSMDSVFPEVPNLFTKPKLQSERVCTFGHTSQNFNILAKELDQVNGRCTERRQRKPQYMQPFVDQVRRIYIGQNCPRDIMMAGRGWHFMNELPEFTVCEDCYEGIVLRINDEHVAKDISTVAKAVPDSKYGNVFSSNGSKMVSCQLYSDNMRRLFKDVVWGRIPWDTFRAEIIERYNAQVGRARRMN